MLLAIYFIGFLFTLGNMVARGTSPEAGVFACFLWPIFLPIDLGMALGMLIKKLENSIDR